MEPRKTPEQELAPLYDALLISLKKVKAGLACPFDPNDRAIYQAKFANSELLANLIAYMDKVIDLELNISPLKPVFSRLTSLCSGTKPLEIERLDDYIQDQIIDPIWNFHYHQVRYPNAPKPPQSVETTFPAEGLPIDVVKIIASNAEAKSMARFFQTSKKIYDYSEVKLMLLGWELLHHIGNGAPEKVKAILDKYPELAVLTCATITTCSGNTYENVTPVQLVYVIDDLDMCNDVFLPCINQMSDQLRQMADEQLAIKMAEVAEQASQFKPYDFSAIVQAITADQQLSNTGKPNPETEQALAKFKEDFKPCLIQFGKSFIKEQLQEGFKVLGQSYGLWSEEQIGWYLINIIGTLQCGVEKCFEQACSQGLKKIVDEKKPLKRSNKIKNYIDKSELTYRGSADSKLILGRDFFVEIYYGSRTFIVRSFVAPEARGRLIIELCRATKSGMEEFKRQLQQPTQKIALGQHSQGR